MNMSITELKKSIHKRPRMYFGNGFPENGANYVVYELVANSIDRFLAGKVTQINIQINDGVLSRNINEENFLLWVLKLSLGVLPPFVIFPILEVVGQSAESSANKKNYRRSFSLTLS